MMLGSFILIYAIAFSQLSGTTATAEFSTYAQCDAAGKAIKKQFQFLGRGNDIEYFCAPK
jgi:hypothetical protein